MVKRLLNFVGRGSDMGDQPADAVDEAFFNCHIELTLNRQTEVSGSERFVSSILAEIDQTDGSPLGFRVEEFDSGIFCTAYVWVV
jgi:hypothetical protein